MIRSKSNSVRRSKSVPKNRASTPKLSYVDKLNFALASIRDIGMHKTYKVQSIDEVMSNLEADDEEEEEEEQSEMAVVSTPMISEQEKMTKYKMIKMILQTDKSLKELEKKTENLINDRVKYYIYWEQIMTQIIAAKRKNCILKKKCKVLNLEVNNGIWEAFRREKMDLNNHGHVRSFDLQRLCHDTLSGAIEMMNVKSKKYSQIRGNTVKEQALQLDDLISRFIEDRRNYVNDNEFTLQQYGRLLKTKEERLKATWDTRYSELQEQIQREIKCPIMDRENQCMKTSTWNVAQLKRVMNEYKDLINQNFFNIKRLTQQLYQKLCYEKHAKRVKELHEAQLISAQYRIFQSKEKYSEMKRFIPSGKVIRAQMTKVLQKRKALSYKYAKISIEKQCMAAKKEQADEKLTQSWDEIKNSLFEGKRNCYKQIHAAMEAQKHQYLSLLVFAQTIENWWHLHLLKSPHEEEKDLSFLERGVTISTFVKPIPAIDYLEKEYKQTLTVYDSTLRLYIHYLKSSCLGEGDLGFGNRIRKIDQTYRRIVKEEKRVFSLIQTDMENVGRGT